MRTPEASGYVLTAGPESPDCRALVVQHIFTGEGVRRGNRVTRSSAAVNIFKRQVVGIARLRQLAQHLLRGNVARLQTGKYAGYPRHRVPVGCPGDDSVVSGLWLVSTLLY